MIIYSCLIGINPSSGFELNANICILVYMLMLNRYISYHVHHQHAKICSLKKKEKLAKAEADDKYHYFCSYLVARGKVSEYPEEFNLSRP